MKIKPSYLFLSFFLLSLFLLQLFFANRLAEEGKELEQITREINKVAIENRRLKIEIASSTCLLKLSLLAKKRGFIKNPPLVNLVKQVPIAARYK